MLFDGPMWKRRMVSFPSHMGGTLIPAESAASAAG
jgi:hypothetical protein